MKSTPYKSCSLSARPAKHTLKHRAPFPKWCQISRFEMGFLRAPTTFRFVLGEKHVSNPAMNPLSFMIDSRPWSCTEHGI